MTFAVNWSDDALDTLAIIWMRSADPKAVTRAQATIDQRLAANPLGHGAPLSEGLWCLEVHPLRALFEVDGGGRSVRVVSLGELP